MRRRILTCVSAVPREILGPGHSGHTLAHESSQTWSASSCGI
jgi:hypothetical protein